ncbi:MAG: hypothetical protein EOP84_04760 [Verrucomicrobiaceae bacterium]|nr:MAG: hypothetical protein EOP84_04760 [Verrucomicrobiaceae bacterium]
MSRNITEALGHWLDAGATQIGQVEIRRTAEGYHLLHFEDALREDLERSLRPEDARHLAVYDDEGRFRPLRTAPNLRHGWLLQLTGLPEVRLALDHFYPGMLGVLVSYEKQQLPVLPLRALLERQTGMYTVTKKITDEEAQTMIGGFCKSQGGCLKTILWPISPEAPVTSLPREKFDPSVNQTGTPAHAIPMLCHEGCNLLVAQARTVVKGRADAK